MKKTFIFLFLLLIASNLIAQKEFHVSVKGNDANDGSISKPFKTIQQAANIANAGDVVIVHEGIYRESINPSRGGTSDKVRITYQAAPNEKVTITGSEPKKGWEKITGNTWKLTIPNSYFGNFNPYNDKIRGDWFDNKGRTHHTGSVYVNGDWMMEARNLDEVIQPESEEPLFYAIVDGNKKDNFLNILWFKPNKVEKISAVNPSLRYGTKPIKCNDSNICTGSINNGDFMRFDNIDFGNGSESIEFKVGATQNCLIEIRLGSSQGELLGTCKVESTGDLQTWKTVTTTIKPTTGKQSIFLVFLGEKYPNGKTTIYANFPNINPNEENIEINKRQTVFYPSKNFINYINSKGFYFRKCCCKLGSAFIGANGNRWHQLE